MAQLLRLWEAVTGLISLCKDIGLDFNVLHLGDCEVILGTQWLSTLGVISWDFQLLTMEFLHLGKRMFLKGLQPASSTISDASKLFSGSIRKGLVLQITTAAPMSFNQPHFPPMLTNLLNEFSKVFAVPTGLPPIRGHEHSINLKEGTLTMCERPYRYPHFQKSEIEKIVNELLEVGSI